MRGFWVSKLLKDGCRKITENWLFCQHFIRRFTESWPRPRPPPPPFHRAKKIEWVRIDWQTNLFFISFSLSLSRSRSDIQYDLLLMILSGWNYIYSTPIVGVVLVWFRGTQRAQKVLFKMFQPLNENNDKHFVFFITVKYIDPSGLHSFEHLAAKINVR